MKNPKVKTGILTALVTAIVVLAIIIVIVLITVYSGAPNVAATDPHWAVTAWVLNTAMENSVRAAAADVNVPGDYNDIDLRVGYSRFNSMCRQCHGAPGMERTWIGKGLRPEPPELSEEAAEWSTAEIFWIVKHGIKMTGMPALSPTHSDDAIWSMAAFVEQLRGMTPEVYEAVGQPAGETAEGPDTQQTTNGHEDSHAHEEPAGEQQTRSEEEGQE